MPMVDPYSSFSPFSHLGIKTAAIATSPMLLKSMVAIFEVIKYFTIQDFWEFLTSLIYFS